MTYFGDVERFSLTADVSPVVHAKMKLQNNNDQPYLEITAQLLVELFIKNTKEELHVVCNQVLEIH